MICQASTNKICKRKKYASTNNEVKGTFYDFQWESFSTRKNKDSAYFLGCLSNVAILLSKQKTKQM